MSPAENMRHLLIEAYAAALLDEQPVVSVSTLDPNRQANARRLAAKDVNRFLTIMQDVPYTIIDNEHLEDLNDEIAAARRLTTKGGD